MRKQILLMDKSSLQRLNKQQRESLDYRYDIRYSHILIYELLIGSIKYGQEKTDQFIDAKIKSLEQIYLDAVAGQHVCYHTPNKLVAKEIIENIPITQMDHSEMGAIEDLKQAIKQESEYAKEQFEVEKKIFDPLKKEIENKDRTNFYIEFSGIINQIGNPRTNQRRLIENFRNILSKYGIDDRQSDMEKLLKDNIQNNRKSFKIEFLQKWFSTDAFTEDMAKSFNENATSSKEFAGWIKLIGWIVNLTEEEIQGIEKIIVNSGDVKFSQKYPYTFFCYYVYLLYFHIEKSEFMIKTQVTNFTRDIRYLLHLPFCDIFLSDDEDLITICKSINYEYFNRLNLVPKGFQKFHPEIMTTKEFIVQTGLSVNK